MKATRIINHLRDMEKAIANGNKDEYLVLLDTLVAKTNRASEHIILGDFDIAVSNGNGLTINISNNGKYIKYISNYAVLTSEDVADKDEPFQETIERIFFDQTDLLFKDIKNDMAKDTNKDEQTEIDYEPFKGK